MRGERGSGGVWVGLVAGVEGIVGVGDRGVAGQYFDTEERREPGRVIIPKNVFFHVSGVLAR